MLAYTFVVLILSSFCFGGDITSPEECEEWYAGYTYTIRWETDDLDDTVTIQFYEDDDTLVEEIVSSTENDGEYEWTVPFYQTTYDDCDPYIFVFSTSGYEFDYFITGDDAARSEPFTIITPIVFGSPNGGQPYNVADTLFKIRWSGPKVHSYDIEYRKQSSPNNSTTITHKYDQNSNEDLNDHVIPHLQPDTNYEFRMNYKIHSSSPDSEWTDFIQVRTYETLHCTDELISAFFSLEVYDNIRTGETKYLGFCGTDWETAYAYESSSDFAAIYSDRSSKRIVVAWRGTEGDNFEDALDNIGVLSTCSTYIDVSKNSPCEVSTGFGRNYVTTSKDAFLSVIEEAIREDFSSLIVTGHSQGGALATVAAADYAAMYSDDITITLLTYGAPEVGNEAFSDLVLATVHRVERFVQQDEDENVDEVTELPSSLTLGLIDFVQLGVDPYFYPCPSDCREDGIGPIPPFYCHCIRGYWANTATRYEEPGFNQGQYGDSIRSSWLTSGEIQSQSGGSPTSAGGFFGSPTSSGERLGALLMIIVVSLAFVL